MTHNRRGTRSTSGAAAPRPTATRYARLAVGAILSALVAMPGCTRPASEPAPAPTAGAAPPRTFADVPIRTLQSDPAAHVGDVFEERFVFFRVWWGADRARPNQLTTDLPTHFEARVAASPLYAARIEFPPADDALVEHWREGTELCLRVRFLRLHETSRSPVFALVGQGKGCHGTAHGP